VRVKVRYFGLIEDITAKRDDFIEVNKDRITIKEVLLTLIQKYGEKFKEAIVDQQGRPKPYVTIVVKSKGVSSIAELNTRLEHDDTILFVPPVGGG